MPATARWGRVPATGGQVERNLAHGSPSDPHVCMERPAMSNGTMSPGRASIAERTLRTDRWWQSPLLTVLGLVAWLALRHRARLHAEGLLRRDLPLPDAVLLARASPRGASDSAEFGTFLPHVWFLPYAALTLPFLLLLPADLLLLPQGLLPRVLAVAAGLRRADSHAKYTGETRLPAARPEPAPLLLLRRRCSSRDQHLGRDPGLPQPAGLRLRPRQPRPARQRRAAVDVHRCPATPAGTSSAAGSTTSPSTRSATSSGCSSPSSTASTCSSPGSRSPASRSPTST